MVEYELSAIDRHFAAFICREGGVAPPWLEIAVSLASNVVGNGNICLNLADLAGRTIRVGGEDVALPPLEELQDGLQRTRVVGSPGAFRPLVLDGGGRLYLYRYWKYEQELARVIIGKAALSSGEIDEALLRAGVGRLFPGSGGYGTDWQKVAAVAAVAKRFCVISGGPGTGKTFTVVKIIAILLEQAKEKVMRIALAAPTGKSAARLNESIRLMKERLECAPAIRELIPDEVSTIHRLLGSQGSSVRFRYSGDNPLPFDAVIIDEASMVALPLMARLGVALKPDARLILLGDRDQLASVEAGAVLGDICGGGRFEPFSPEFADLVARVAGERIPAQPSAGLFPILTDSLVVLKRNYRFGGESGIGEVGRAVNAGDGVGAIALLKGESLRGLAWQSLPKPDGLRRALSGTVVDGYGNYLAAESPAEALASFDAFRVLCALRQGPYGVAGINAIVEDILAGKGLIDLHSRWYRGRPVMITVNDYNLRLFNGDVGIVFPDAEAGGSPRVFFPAPGGGVRRISPVRLPPHETVYAMTIHKSQGSEFDRVLMLLPDHDSELLTRELIYTGITRAKAEAEIWGDEEIFVKAVSRRIERKSGLREALWNTGKQ
jgi:exodeoxyribonuclease V alpha subunit